MKRKGSFWLPFLLWVGIQEHRQWKNFNDYDFYLLNTIAYYTILFYHSSFLREKDCQIPDATGKRIYEKRLKPSDIVDLSDTPTGLYLMRVGGQSFRLIKVN